MHGPEGDPDPGHGHGAELLPHVRQALGHDRHRRDRGGRVRRASTSWTWWSSPPTGRSPASTTTTSSTRPRRRSTRPSSTRWTRLHELGLPVLVGTTTVEVSELLSRLLRLRGINHNVLNAKHHKTRGGDRGRGRPAWARSPSPPTWPAAAPTSSWRRRCWSCPRHWPADPNLTPEMYEGQATGPADHRHRAPREPPHRPPAARPLRPPGRSRAWPSSSSPSRTT